MAFIDSIASVWGFGSAPQTLEYEEYIKKVRQEMQTDMVKNDGGYQKRKNEICKRYPLKESEEFWSKEKKS